MNVALLVDRGLEIRAELKRLKVELAAIETKLENAGLKARHADLKDADREGRRWLARGSSLIVPVVFTADRIVGEFKDKSLKHSEIVLALEKPAVSLRDFFRPVNKWENLFDDGKKFRTRAGELLGDNAPGFVTACLARDKDGLPKSDVKIVWDDAEEASAVGKAS